jgi:hypothetical protein
VSTATSIDAASPLPLLELVPLASKEPLLVAPLDPVLDPKPLELLVPLLEPVLLPLSDASPPLPLVAPSPV